jgi:hypothetical protein
MRADKDARVQDRNTLVDAADRHAGGRGYIARVVATDATADRFG